MRQSCEANEVTFMIYISQINQGEPKVGLASSSIWKCDDKVFFFTFCRFYYSNLLFFNCKHHRKTSPLLRKKIQGLWQILEPTSNATKADFASSENLCKIAFNGCLLKYKLDLHGG
jgi:hypothetical protein